MSDNDDSRHRTVSEREYTMISNETWIDVKDLTVNITKGVSGIKVWVYPREMIDNAEPLAICEADYIATTKRRANVIPFMTKGWRGDPKR